MSLKINYGNYHDRIMNIPHKGCLGGCSVVVHEDMENMTLKEIFEALAKRNGVKVGEFNVEEIVFGYKIIDVEALDEEQKKSLRERGCEW